MQRKSLWKLSAALALPIMALAASTQAVTLYSSAGFDGFGYTPGADLNGQAGWTKYTGASFLAPGSAVVTAGAGLPAGTTNGVNFTQTVATINATPFTTAYYQPVAFPIPASDGDNKVQLSFDMRLNSAFTNIASLAGVEIFDGANIVAAAYVGTQGGQTTVNAANNAAASNTNAQAPVGTYAHYDVIMDFLTKKYSIFVGGVPEILNLNFASGATNTFNEVDLTFYNGQGQSVSIDNLVLTSLPEPASLSLLGLAGLGLMARRRK